MADPNWLKFQREVDWTPEVHAAISHLGIEIPPEGRPLRFRCPSASVEVASDGCFVCWRGWHSLRASLVAGNGDEVIAALQPMPAYGASGKALRAWLQLWGWTPPVKGQAATTTLPSPMVT
jgi:hypothetical protein